MSWIDGNQKKTSLILPEKEWERQFALEGFLEEEEAKRELFKFFRNNISIAANILMGVDLFPYQHILLKTSFEADYALNIIGRAGGKSWVAAVFAGLYALMNPGVKVGILSVVFRQARTIFKYLEDIASKEKGQLFNSCIGKVEHKNDEWSMKIGDSIIVALPLGCLKGDIFVHYEDGLRQIGEDFIPGIEKDTWIEKEDSVWSEGKFRYSDRKFYHGLAKTKRIVTKRGYEIEGTLNHKIKVKGDDKNVIWKDLRDISVGDLVPIDAKLRDFKNISGLSPDEAEKIGEKGADNIPKEVLSGGSQCHSRFMRGLYLSRGIMSEKKVILNLKEHKLAKGVQQMLLGRGIVSIRNLEDNSIEILDEYRDGDIYYDEVILTEDSECETFDLSVPENNSYCANGFISHNSGEKIRGFRFNCIVIDELLLMPKKVLNEVILPFLGAVQNPDERAKLREAEDFLVSSGVIKDDERYVWPNNKLIGLSSASYKFEYLYELYKVYEALICGNEKLNDENEVVKAITKQKNARRAIVHMSYEAIPKDIYDQDAVEQAVSQMSQSQFDREFRSIFTDDSSGFFRISRMNECTLEEGSEPSIEIKGDPQSEYLIAIDPSWSENDSSDHFAMQVVKLDKERQNATLVHSYAVAGGKLKNHIRYFLYLLENFNTVMVWSDYAGGLQFINSCNESELFKARGLNLQVMQEEFEANEKYLENVSKGKSEYSKESKKFVVFRKFSTDWIRKGNELLQANFDHKKIWFGAKTYETTYIKQLNHVIPIDDIEFLDESNYAETGQARQIDLIERQHQLMDLTKTECALIQVRSNPQGTQVFDLPENIKRISGPNRTRRDSYTALVIANWGAKVYFDMMNAKKEPVFSGFTPMMF